MNIFIPCCFWCGSEKRTIIIPGKLPGNRKIPQRTVVDLEPCDSCRQRMKSIIDNDGILIFEIDTAENVGKAQVLGRVDIRTEKDFYYTGNMVSMEMERFKKCFRYTEHVGDEADAYNESIRMAMETHVLVIQSEIFNKLFPRKENDNAENID